jgi:hypothetical protein
VIRLLVTQFQIPKGESDEEDGLYEEGRIDEDKHSQFIYPTRSKYTNKVLSQPLYCELLIKNFTKMTT